MVLYNERDKGGQCGGTSTKHTGTGNACVKIAHELCANPHIGAKANFGICAFDFKYEGGNRDCQGPTGHSALSIKREDTNGVKLDDDIRFLSILCSKTMS